MLDSFVSVRNPDQTRITQTNAAAHYHHHLCSHYNLSDHHQHHLHIQVRDNEFLLAFITQRKTDM